jgi:carbamate kinase
MRVVIALGGNALLKPHERPDFNNYLQTVRKTCRSIAALAAKGYEVVLTHGNGMQAGNLLIQQDAAKDKALTFPLDVCVAETQGQIDYLIQQGLRNEFRKIGVEKEVVSVITQVLVDKDDPDFKNPTKPVGPFYSEEETKELSYNIKKIGDKFRRIVPSPKPIDIIEKECIKEMVEKGHVVISCGGGGIPVTEENSEMKGIEAVIDKDRTAQLLASLLKADILLIATDVDAVYLNYGRKNQKKLGKVKLEQMKSYLKEGQFPPGSMGPKVEAVINFLEKGGRSAVIASIEDIEEAVGGKRGTVVTR